MMRSRAAPAVQHCLAREVVLRTSSSSPSSTTPDGSGGGDSTTTHFGYREVPVDEKVSLVREVFENVAPKYDIMNDVMSGTLHRTWKDDFVRSLAPRPGCRHIDVAGGTGDIAFRIYDRIERRLPSPGGAFSRSVPATDIFVADINPSMLEVGQERALDQGYCVATELGEEPPAAAAASGGVGPTPRLHFVECNAERLDAFEDGSFDSYTIAFGIRNVTDIPAALREAARVLRPGGRFMCLEFSRVRSAALRQLYEGYSDMFIPTMGELVAGDRDSYQYLVESIRRFPPQEEFSDMLRSAGLSHVQHTNFLDGVVASHSGFKL